MGIRSIPQDPGPAVRWFYLTASALRRVPASVPDPLAWARENPAVLVLRRENQIVWRRAQDPSCRPVEPASEPVTVIRRRGHLAVVK